MRNVAALGVLLGCVCSPVAVAAAPATGWLYIHRYLSSAQVEVNPGIATAPMWFFDSNNALVPSRLPDGRQEPGRRVQVPVGTYYVVAGDRNVGLTRVKYAVVQNRVTIVKSGFVQVTTWKVEELPKIDCAPWDAEMTAFVRGERPGGGGETWLPVLSNPAVEYGTREFGMLQLPVGAYRIDWHGFTADVEVKEGKVYRLPVGTAGPLGEDRPKGRLSVKQGEAADNPSLLLCDDGPTHVIAGKYWLSFAKRLDEFPYEERVWTQLEVEAINKYGYVRTMRADNTGRGLHRGPGSDPAAAPLQSLERPSKGSAAAGDSATKSGSDGLLGGEGGIDWDAPP